jgi:hypothetical protein
LQCDPHSDCPIGTWVNISSLPNQDVYSSVDYKYTIEYFGNCVNGKCPARKNIPKSVRPGYNTHICEAWKYEEISCKSAEFLYKQVLELRYGISNCCVEDIEQYTVQKELINLQALISPSISPPTPPPPTPPTPPPPPPPLQNVYTIYTTFTVI